MYEGDLSLAFELADAAAEISVARFHRGDARIDTKPDGSPVTDVDVEVEVCLRSILGDRASGDGVTGEELGIDTRAERRWYVDPIDGTTAFCQGSPRWGTLIGLAVESKVVVGVVDIPLLGKRYWASKGSGAYDNGIQLAVSQMSTLDRATVSDDYRHSIERRDKTQPLYTLSLQCGIALPNKEYSMLAVATGRADVALMTGGGPWDYAPFVVIVEEAGGLASDEDGSAWRGEGFLLGTNGRVHDEALEALRDRPNNW
jgi:histidinol-phosphatase